MPIDRDRRHLDDQVDEVAGGEEVRSFCDWKKIAMMIRPTKIGSEPSSPALTSIHQLRDVRRRGSRRRRRAGRRRARAAPRPVRCGGAHATTSSGAGHVRELAGGDRLDDLVSALRLLALELGDVLAEPQHGDRSATSKMSCRLCEMSMTASPCSPEARTRSSTCRVWATPSAAVGSSRITSLRVPHHGLGDRDGLALAAGQAGDGLADGADRRDREARERLARASPSSVSSSAPRAPPSSSRPRNMFWTTSRLSPSARSW